MHHPAFYAMARVHARRALREQGKSFSEINEAMNLTDNDLIDSVADDVPPMVGSIGDGKIIQAIIDFFKSPQGQAIIAALVKMILSLLVAA